MNLYIIAVVRTTGYVSPLCGAPRLSSGRAEGAGVLRGSRLEFGIGLVLLHNIGSCESPCEGKGLGYSTSPNQVDEGIYSRAVDICIWPHGAKGMARRPHDARGLTPHTHTT